MNTDYIGFSFGKTHLLRELNIYRTSDGSRYNTNLAPSMSDKTVDAPGRDGQYYFGTTHKNKTFSVSFAFDSLTEDKLRQLQKLFDGKKIDELIFDEQPYKAYSAKVTGQPQLKTICFDDGEGNRVYKGEGTVQFTCYHPYAHTPNWLWFSESGEQYSWKEVDGRLFSNYTEEAYPSRDEWNVAARLTDDTSINLGDVEAPFVVTGASGTVTVGDNTITIEGGPGTWDSKTGLVTKDGEILLHTGNSCATIAPGAAATTNSGVLDYEYWYY